MSARRWGRFAVPHGRRGCATREAQGCRGARGRAEAVGQKPRRRAALQYKRTEGGVGASGAAAAAGCAEGRARAGVLGVEGVCWGRGKARRWRAGGGGDGSQCCWERSSQACQFFRPLFCVTRSSRRRYSTSHPCHGPSRRDALPRGVTLVLVGARALFPFGCGGAGCPPLANKSDGYSARPLLALRRHRTIATPPTSVGRIPNGS